MNYAFIVTNTLDSNQSVFVKQAPPYIKVLGEDWPLTRQRMTAEINALSYQSSVCPEMVPDVYYQSESFVSAYHAKPKSTRYFCEPSLYNVDICPDWQKIYLLFWQKTLFYSSDFALPSAEKKVMVNKSGNQDMCKITEDFVFTYPFEHHEMNDYNPALTQSVIDSVSKRT